MSDTGKLVVLPSNDEARLIIEGFTREDFLSAEGTPFKWLYSFRDNPFAFNRFKTLLAEHAKNIRVPNFASICKGYAESNKMTTPRDESMTMFSGQDVVLRSGTYICTDDGVAEFGQSGVETVCHHPIMPVERMINIETGEVKTRIAYKRGRSWRRPVFDKATLSSARNILALSSCGVDVTSESAKALVRYIAYMEEKNYDAIPETKMVDRLGWIDGEGFSPFIDGVVYDSSGQFDEEFKSIRTGGSYDVWKKLAGEVRRSGPAATRIALAASFASPLVKKLDALPFIVHLWGSVSGIGKSVALILAASVWAYPEIGYYVKTTKATDVALEQLAYFSGNMPLCLDELQLIQGSRDGFDRMIYALCEGIGKSRGSKNGGLQAVRRWCNSIITTGEQPITAANSKAGAVNRVLEVEVSEKTFPDPRAAYQTLIHNYGHAGRDFVEKLSKDKELLEEVRAVQQDFYDKLNGHATDKQVLTASIILAADYIAGKAIFGDGCSITPEEIREHMISRESADTSRRAYDCLCEWIASNPQRFEAQNERYNGECWGKLENDEEGNPIRACIIRSAFDRVLTESAFSPAAFLSWASKEGKIQRNGKAMTMARRIVKGGPLVRCVVLNLPTEEDEAPWEAEKSAFEPTQEEIPFWLECTTNGSVVL